MSIQTRYNNDAQYPAPKRTIGQLDVEAPCGAWCDSRESPWRAPSRHSIGSLKTGPSAGDSTFDLFPSFLGLQACPLGHSSASRTIHCKGVS